MNVKQVNTFERGVRQASLLAACLFLALSGVACSRQSQRSSQGSEQTSANRTAHPLIDISPADTAADSDDRCAEMFSSFFGGLNSVSFGVFEVVRLQKTVRDAEYNVDILVTYAALKTSGGTIATFDGLYSEGGNQTDFGLASVLGGDTTQLLVSQTIRRYGRHWIVDLTSNVVTLFDSDTWEIGGEDVCIHDFDDDGVSEISMAITRFWGFDAMSMHESPMPGVVFKYNEAVRKYLPDKVAFAAGLNHIEEDVEAIDPNEDPEEGSKGSYLAVRLDIFLRYIYAGRESEAWSFFNKTYSLADKEQIRLEIKHILEFEPVYRFVYGLQPIKQPASRSNAYS
jgi:hypothetical protein